MANRNGLISSRDVAATGAVASNFFVRKGEPIESPLVINSPDGTKSAIVAESNAGQMTIGTESGIVNVISDDGVSANFLFSNNDALEVVGLNTALLESYNSGLQIIAGTTQASVKVGAGALGRIYDTVYNPTYVISLLNDNTSGNIAYDVSATRAAGVYQVQLTVETAVPAATTFLSTGTFAPPSTSLMNFSGQAVSATSIATGQDFCLNSGFITHAGGSLRVVVVSSGAAWTGNWSLQLVKMG